MQLVQVLAQFRRHYADGALYASARYRTADGVIPFGVFWIYYRELGAQVALERLSAMRATLSAIGLAFSKEHAPLPDSVRRDLRAARLSER